MLTFKRTTEQTQFKYYKTPYNSEPDDLVKYGNFMMARIPEVNSTCPEKPILYRVAGGDLNYKGCMITASDHRRIDFQTVCMNEMALGYYRVSVEIRNDDSATMPDDTFVIFVIIAETPREIVACTKDPVSCKYEEIFNKYDTNSDGFVATASLQFVVNAGGLAPSLQQLEQMIADVDPTSTGTFDSPTLISNVKTWQDMLASVGEGCTDTPTNCKFQQLFSTYDTNNDGEVNTSML